MWRNDPTQTFVDFSLVHHYRAVNYLASFSLTERLEHANLLLSSQANIRREIMSESLTFQLTLLRIPD